MHQQRAADADVTIDPRYRNSWMASPASVTQNWKLP